MIETSNPEIDVNELMERVRVEAAKISRRENPSGRLNVPARHGVLPAIPEMPAPPRLGISRPLDQKKERMAELLRRAREMTDRSAIPKMFRRWFRKQGGYNRTILASLTSLAKTNEQLNKRVQESAIVAAQQDQWLRALAGQRQTEAAWLQTAAPMLSSSASAIEQLNAQLEGLNERFGDLQGQAERSSEQFGNLLDQTDRQAEQIQSWHASLERAEEHVRNLQAQTDRQQEQFGVWRDQVQGHGEHLRNLQGQADGHDTHLRRLQEQADKQGVEEARMGAEIHHFAHLQRTLALLEERQVNDAIYMKGELSLARLQQRGTSAGRKKETAPAELEAEAADAHRLDNFYLSFENRFRGTRAEIKERVRFYLPFLKKAKAGVPARPILDVGCGRGEWLELLQENGLKAAGVDLNSAMVAQCTERNLQVTHADAIAYLRTLPADSQGAVSGFHIIEHLPFEVLMDLFAETRRVLQPGGLAIFESPNCKNLTVGACNFNIDPTHRNPVFPETAQFMLETQGFEGVRLEYLSPTDQSPFSGDDQDSRALTELLYGPQDFGVIARKPKG